MKKVLFVGESWSATLMEVKGFNSFLSSKYETGLGWIDKAIEKAGYEFVYMPNHIANDHFPFTLEELNEYSCIILSDVGADTLLIPSATFGASKILPNRCQLLKDYVLGGGGLLMIGGYLTFNGVGAQGKWWATPVQDVLPVEILPYDDRMEHCEGVHAEVTLPDHPAFAGIEGEWPPVLGYNKSTINRKQNLPPQSAEIRLLRLAVTERENLLFSPVTVHRTGHHRNSATGNIMMCYLRTSWIILQNNQNHRKCDSKVKNTRRY